MLTKKSVATTGSWVATKSASKKTALPDRATPAKTNNAASPQALYSVNEPRPRTERSLFSVLLARTDAGSDMELEQLVHNRLPLSVIDRLLAEGVSKQEMELVAPPRTLAHRRANEEKLTIDESDRAVRLARIVAQSESVFGNKDKAMAWLRQSMKRFEGRSPIGMLSTDVGCRLVEEVLVQIDEGFFA